jgi:SAM-dependent methyltransferase
LIDKRAAWDLFWTYDRLSSFGTGSGAGNYGEPIAAGWRDLFGALPRGAQVFDLCTGNGAIAVMAVEFGDKLKVTGADLASVRPAAFASRNKEMLDKIRFLANTPAEQLPLADASFDAVVSQYGVEYSNMEQSLPEAVRVLAPGGRLRFAMHAAEGSVAASTRRAIDDADFLLDEIDLLARATSCFKAIVDVERGRTSGPFAQTAAQAHYAAFRDGLKAVADRTGTAADVAMLESIHRSLMGLFQDRLSHDDAALMGKVDALRIEVEAHRTRERALLEAARSREQMAALARQLESLGLAGIERGEQRNGADLIGHVIEARLPRR